MFECLAHQRCRLVFAYFQETGNESATVDELVDYAMEQEAPTPDRKSVTISMHHVHLPKLADNYFIIYDTERSAATITDRSTQILPQLVANSSSEKAETAAEITDDCELER